MNKLVTFNTYENKFKQEFKSIDLKQEFFPDFFIEQIKLNTINSVMNLIFEKKEYELVFSFIKVLRNSASEIYFDVERSDFSDILFHDDQVEPILFVIFEKNLGVIHSNSNRLLCEILVKQFSNNNFILPNEINEHIDQIRKIYNQYK